MITLTHTRMQVPHNKIRVTSLRQVDVGTGIAWSARLRQGRTKLGLISNEGRADPNMFAPENTNARRTVATYVNQCRDTDGASVDEDEAMDKLTAEYEWARDIARVEKRGGFVLRHFDDIGIPGVMVFAVAHIAPPEYERAVPAAKRMAMPLNAERTQLWMGPGRGWVTFLPAPQTSN